MKKRVALMLAVAAGMACCGTASAVPIGGQDHRVGAVAGAVVGAKLGGPAGAVVGYAAGHQAEAELIHLRKDAGKSWVKARKKVFGR